MQAISWPEAVVFSVMLLVFGWILVAIITSTRVGRYPRRIKRVRDDVSSWGAGGSEQDEVRGASQTARPYWSWTQVTLTPNKKVSAPKQNAPDKIEPPSPPPTIH